MASARSPHNGGNGALRLPPLRLQPNAPAGKSAAPAMRQAPAQEPPPAPISAAKAAVKSPPAPHAPPVQQQQRPAPTPPAPPVQQPMVLPAPTRPGVTPRIPLPRQGDMPPEVSGQEPPRHSPVLEDILHRASRLFPEDSAAARRQAEAAHYCNPFPRLLPGARFSRQTNANGEEVLYGTLPNGGAPLRIVAVPGVWGSPPGGCPRFDRFITTPEGGYWVRWERQP